MQLGNSQDNCPYLNDCTNESEKQRKINEMNRHFCETGKKLAEKLPMHNGKTENPKRIFNFKTTNATEVENIIKNLKNSKAIGSDGLSTHLIKTAAPFIAQNVSNIINTCLTNAIMPNSFKIMPKLSQFTSPTIKASLKTLGLSVCYQ